METMKEQNAYAMIPLANGDFLPVATKEAYEAIADYVRNKDHRQYVAEALKYITEIENLEKYVTSDEARLEKFAAILDEKLEIGKGKIEYEAAQELSKIYEMALYRIISNKNTIYEQEDEAILPKELAEKLSSLDEIRVLNTDGDQLNSTYISEVIYIEPYVL